jgi:6-phosphogluconolactonase (cycloisomerase 2 family)
MLKKAAALFLVGAGLATWVGCGSTSSRYLYASIPVSNEIVAFREDPNSGVLTQLVGSPITAGQAVQALALHPSKKYLYAANSGEDTVSLFTISSTGVLEEQLPRTPTGTGPNLLAIDAAGAYLYVANSGSFDLSVFSISAGNGALTLVPIPGGNPVPLGMSPINMALSSSGILYITGSSSNGVSSNGLIETYTLSQGVPTFTALYLTGTNPYGLAITPSGGFLYTANNVDDSLSEFTIASGGALTPLTGSPIGETYSGPVALQINPAGSYMYVADEGSGNLAAFSIGTDGGLTLLTSSPFTTAAQPATIGMDPSGKYLFVGNQKSPAIQSFSVDTSDGALTSVSSYGVPYTPTSIVVTQ